MNCIFSSGSVTGTATKQELVKYINKSLNSQIKISQKNNKHGNTERQKDNSVNFCIARWYNSVSVSCFTCDTSLGVFGKLE